LVELVISWNKLRPKGVIAFLECLKKNNTLQVLVCVFVCVYLFVCMCTCAFKSVCNDVHVPVHVCPQAWTHPCMHAFLRGCWVPPHTHQAPCWSSPSSSSTLPLLLLCGERMLPPAALAHAWKQLGLPAHPPRPTWHACVAAASCCCLLLLLLVLVLVLLHCPNTLRGHWVVVCVTAQKIGAAP